MTFNDVYRTTLVHITRLNRVHIPQHIQTVLKKCVKLPWRLEFRSTQHIAPLRAYSTKLSGNRLQILYSKNAVPTFKKCLKFLPIFFASSRIPSALFATPNGGTRICALFSNAIPWCSLRLKLREIGSRTAYKKCENKIYGLCTFKNLYHSVSYKIMQHLSQTCSFRKECGKTKQITFSTMSHWIGTSDWESNNNIHCMKYSE